MNFVFGIHTGYNSHNFDVWHPILLHVLTIVHVSLSNTTSITKQMMFTLCVVTQILTYSVIMRLIYQNVKMQNCINAKYHVSVYWK